MAKYVLGLDLGTSSAHCLLVGPKGRVAAAADVPMEYYPPAGGATLAREFRPSEVLQNLGRAVTKVCREAQASPHDIASIGITSQGQGTVLLDRDGRELYCGPNIDLRAVFQGAELDEVSGPEIYRTTGHFPSLMFAPARVNWFRSHQPEVLDKASRLLSIAGWLGYRLTGQVAATEGLDCELGLIDLATRKHAHCLLEKLEFPVELLPPLTKAGQAIGSLAAGLAEQWGLPAGIPVTLADSDSRCGLLGMGLALDKDAGAVLGWSASVQMLTDGPRLDLDCRSTWAGCYPIGRLYTVDAKLGDAGHAFDWLVRTIGGGQLSHQAADHLAGEAPRGCDGVACFLGPGPKTAPQAGLGLGGVFLPTPVTYHEPTPAHIFRGYFESVAYSIKSNLAAVAEVAGQPATALYLGGGMARSDVLATVLPDVLGIPVNRSLQPQVSALGAASAAWVSAGMYSCMEESVSQQSHEFQEQLPEPGHSAEYQEYYQDWLELYRRLSPEA
ncbi:MAG: FGGY-family carbohydrate kinase [Chloroflexi bacterium]|nr:FGGY-family carbohydrate kinase [Chloroflexota bacterium]